MNPTVSQAHCPACQKVELREAIERETFPYGEESIEIVANVPVIRCDSCGFAYTDQRAEAARHAAVCAHIGLLSPEEIQHTRKTVLGMSREAFHAAYGLSSASVERWENGKLFQGEAADTLMRALRDRAMARLLDRRTASVEQPSTGIKHDNVIWGRFPSLGSIPTRAEDALTRSRDFSLRIQAR